MQAIKKTNSNVEAKCKDIKIREMFGLRELEFYLTIYYLELIVAEQIFNICDVH
jgi:hypothetical protein